MAGPRKGSTPGYEKQHRARVHRIKIDQKPDELIRDLYNAEFGDDMSSTELGLSQEDRQWKKKVEESVKLKEGHYEIGLPLKDDDVRLPSNRNMALRRLCSLERKLKRDTKFTEHYTTFMKNLLDEGYAEEVPEGNLSREDGRVWYVPHHGVYHPHKPDKVRVVFDCAARHGNVSLNDVLLQGPDLTSSLLGVLLRFRTEPVAFMADIRSMFYQVTVPESDRDLLRFLWWPEGDISAEPKDFRMKVHIFGASSSPSCSNFALRRTADDCRSRYSAEATDTVRRNFYVDDCLRSASSEEEARLIATEVQALCAEGGFHLTKFVANRKSVLQDLAQQDCSQKMAVDVDKDVCQNEERALGVRWKIDDDALGFSVKTREVTATRRGILSVISSIYDPLGIAGPFLLRGKQLLQGLCRREIGWDDRIPDDEARMWKKWLEELPKLSEVTVDRCLKTPEFGCVTKSQLHHFCDASEGGYGAVVYLRQENEEGRIHCAFVMGKSRVAPLKKVTVPRLELSAATTSVRLNTTVQRELDSVDVHETFFWTDSTAVLRYVNNDKVRYQTFVANRLAVIKDGSTASQWRYVPSQDNPADDASRGLHSDTLRERARWLHGPEFLWEDESQWPQMPFSAVSAVAEDDPEVKRKAVCTATLNREEEVSPTDKLIRYFSCWHRLKKAVAWVLRVKTMLQDRRRKRLRGLQQDVGKNEKQKLRLLTTDELQEAEDAVIRYVQRQSFPEEVALMEGLADETRGSTSQAEKKLRRSSRLYGLNPVVKNGIMRVGGRLQRSEYPYESKHPVILPKRGHMLVIWSQSLRITFFSFVVARQMHQVVSPGCPQAAAAG
ncbi:uncharacterized protein LOC122391859 [Amphibalanus amphitrite]|uniref:uncharacterized protein LOC122391859 n=1 Tax=Amphibalanus amphitrite TaxID=1232801 RepID=UPI001C92250E|nr:uncharacterized protein LOC122391859 [Amphibalanus amphitrite]